MSFLRNERKDDLFLRESESHATEKKQKAPETSYLDVACCWSSIGVTHHTSLGFNSEFWFLCFMLDISFNIMLGHFPTYASV